MPSAQLSCFDTTTGWWAECLGVGFVVGRRLIEGGAVPCLSPVVTDFPEISRKFEGLRLELVSRNFALVQQKDAPGPRLKSPPPERLKARPADRDPRRSATALTAQRRARPGPNRPDRAPERRSRTVTTVPRPHPPGKVRDRVCKRWPLNTVLIVNRSNNRTTIEVVNNRM